ncbi:MAG: fatty acid desaturase [Pseudomonadota bacterium]|nr:fatty acid desaturase [Pseudomonadota bacterium]
MARPHEVPDLDRSNCTGDLGYHVTQLGDPHRRRRREILARHPEVATLQGHDLTQTWITVLVVAGQLAIAWAMQRYGAPWWLVVAGAYVVGAVANHWSGVVMHEATHNLAAPGGNLPNRIVGLFANLPVVVPSAMSFRRYHLDHHTWLGVERLDNDLPLRREVQLVGTSTFRKLLWLFFYSLFAVFARDFFRRPNRWEVLGVLIQAALVTWVIAAIGWVGLAYLLLSTLFAFGAHPIAGHFVQEHYLSHGAQETYSYYGPLNLLTFNMGYHVEHHDFMNIPGSRLPALHAMAPEFYAPLVSHRSWTRTLLAFLTDDRMGHFSRKVRTYDTWRVSQAPAAPVGDIDVSC